MVKEIVENRFGFGAFPDNFVNPAIAFLFEIPKRHHRPESNHMHVGTEEILPFSIASFSSRARAPRVLDQCISGEAIFPHEDNRAFAQLVQRAFVSQFAAELRYGLRGRGEYNMPFPSSERDLISIGAQSLPRTSRLPNTPYIPTDGTIRPVAMFPRDASEVLAIARCTPRARKYATHPPARLTRGS